MHCGARPSDDRHAHADIVSSGTSRIPRSCEATWASAATRSSARCQAGTTLVELIKIFVSFVSEGEAPSLDFVAKKMVEVARFTEGPAWLAKEKVKALQKRSEDGPARLQQFRASTAAERKRSHLLEDSASAADGIQP